MKPKAFQTAVLTWFENNGRKHLPWQQRVTAYRVWISEIMLQQTQVKTVIPYFKNFIKKFPTVTALAAADLNEVLHCWTGLGYYSRARNLHKAAQMIVNKFKGRFPREINDVMQLPGIGRSTAGAICAIAFKQATPILDGNVKRVLARFKGISGWPGEMKVQQQLWDIAEIYMPQTSTAEYTQAMMDLGAMICTRTKPKCDECPLQKNCVAFKDDRIDELPGKKPKRELPIKTTQMLILQNESQHVLLEQRPEKGIWGGLWSLPQCIIDTDISKWLKQHYGLQLYKQRMLKELRHTFSHFHLDIQPVIVNVKSFTDKFKAAENQMWYDINDPAVIGLPAPIKKLLEGITNHVPKNILPKITT